MTNRTRALFVLAALSVLAGGCVIAPPPGTPVPPRIEVVARDPGAFGWGTRPAELLDQPALRPGFQAMFGANWSAAGEGGRGVSAPAPTFFTRALTARVLRVAGVEYLAATGCTDRACAAQRGLLVVRGDGAFLLARLDDGGFTHYYAFGPDARVTADTRAMLDAVWRALER